MTTRPFRKQGGGDEDSFRQQSNVENSFNGLRNSLILDGILIEDVFIGTTETLVSHKLSRPIRGYLICKNNVLTQIADTVGTYDKTLFIGLKAGTACTISLWIF